MSVGVTVGTAPADGVTAATSGISVKWTTRTATAGSYLAEEITGMAKVEFGPMPAASVQLVLRERQSWFDFQAARIRVLAADMQAFVARSAY